MIQFVNYNFINDGNSLDPFPTNINIDSVKLQNAEYRGLYITQDVNSPYSTDIPTEWDFYTLLLANFNGNINGGSVDYDLEQLDSIRIKRRKKGTFDWELIYEQLTSVPADLRFSNIDYFGADNTEYEYAWIPVLNGNEGEYIQEEIKSKFNGVFICDTDTIFKLYAGVAYGTSQQFQQVGVYNPLGRKYPIYVSNGLNNYQTGSVTAKIVGDYETTGIFDRKKMVEEKNALLKWLTNKKAKILKDNNSNIWLCFITETPSVSYDSQWGNGMMEISFQYGEIGDAENIEDMQNAGLRPVTLI